MLVAICMDMLTTARRKVWREPSGPSAPQLWNFRDGRFSAFCQGTGSDEKEEVPRGLPEAVVLLRLDLSCTTPAGGTFLIRCSVCQTFLQAQLRGSAREIFSRNCETLVPRNIQHLLIHMVHDRNRDSAPELV